MSVIPEIINACTECGVEQNDEGVCDCGSARWKSMTNAKAGIIADDFYGAFKGREKFLNRKRTSKSSYPVALQENRFVDFLAWAIAHVNNPTLRHPFCPFCCSDKLAVGEMMLGDSFEDKNLS